MNALNLTLLILAAAAGAGGVAAYFKRGEGKATIDLLKTQIESYKDTEMRNVAQIKELQAIVITKDTTIAEQRQTIKSMVKEFKEYKNAS